MPAKNISQNIDSLKKLPMFFILGRPRSGTTLLASLFDAHSNVILPFECPLIINMFTKYASKKNWRKSDLEEFYNDVITQRKFDSWNVNTASLKADLKSCEGETNFQELMKVVYASFPSFFNKSKIIAFGDKNPIYSIYPKQLIKLYPEAKFIHLSRDYRDNILSIKKVDFEAPFTSLLAWRWRYSAKLIEKTKKKFPENYYSVRYEDLVTDPKSEIQKLCNFIGISYQDSVLQYHEKVDELFKLHDKKHIEKYHSSLLQPISADKIFAYKKTMPEKDVRLADFIVGKYAEISGYERQFNEFDFSLIIPAAFGFIYGRFAFMLRFLTDQLPYKIKMYSRNQGPLLAVIFNKLMGK